MRPSRGGERLYANPASVKMLAGLLLAALVLTAPGAALAAPSADITLDTVYAKEPLWGRGIDRVSWAPGGKWFTYVRLSQDASRAEPLMVFDVATGAGRVWLAPSAFGPHAETPAMIDWSPDGKRAAVIDGGDLYVARIRSTGVLKIASDVDDAQWSPRGDAIAYAHGADLYVARLGKRGLAQRLTRGGVPSELLNATLDWVYPEELGIEHAFRWSPDARQIAYLTMDERKVTNFPIVDFLTRQNAVAYERYPLSGEHNPRVTLRLVDVNEGTDRLVYDAATRDEYIAAFDWIPRTQAIEAEILDRRQQAMRVDRFDGAGAPATTLYRQTSSSWVDVQPLPRWLPDGRSVWLLDRATTAGVYLRGRDGTLRALTHGYRVFAVDGVAGGRTIYAWAAYPTRRDRHLIAVTLDGGVRDLTATDGWHAVTLAPTFDRYVDAYSTLNDPPQTALVTTSSPSESTVLVPEATNLRDALLPAEMVQVPSQYGMLDATMVKPPGFDPSKKYPVVVYVYGGPDAPTTANRFGGLYHQLLARQGVIVFSIDGPASQVDSDAHVRMLLHNFGPGSLLGQEVGARYLASLPYVDAARIGIWGWSFGGYETCYAMTHSTLFKAGAAVAPVTDWHFYDSIYTERYMGMPGDSPTAYKNSSVLYDAAHLNGPLLIQHGTADDNVHMANTIQLLQRFILARTAERVTFYPYPRKTHGIRGLPQQRSVFAHMLEFWKANL